jgi:hypothetical protein
MKMEKMYFYQGIRLQKIRLRVCAESREEADEKAEWNDMRSIISSPDMETEIIDVSYLGEGDEYWDIFRKDSERIKKKTQEEWRRRRDYVLEKRKEKGEI